MLRKCTLSAIALALALSAGGGAWGQTQVLPPPAGLPITPAPPAGLPLAETSPEPSILGWQTFVAYRETLRWAGGVGQALVVLLVLTHLALYGVHRVRPTGRLVRRYGPAEVVLHALLALAFVGAWASSTYLVLAKHVLGYAETGLPVPLGRVSSTAHLAAGVLFLVALGALGALWGRSMRFVGYDVGWLRALGGYFSRRHAILPAGRFNAGQKIWFHVALVLGGLVGLSGGLLYVPALLGPPAGIAFFIAHTVLAVTLSALVVAHVYVAVIAHPYGLQAVITGKSDEACLREDHPLEATGRRVGPG